MKQILSIAIYLFSAFLLCGLITVKTPAAPGALDLSFGSGGKVITPIGSSIDYAYSAAIQSDGKIVAAGGSQSGNFDFAVVRYNADGTLDTSFGGTGKVTTQVGSSSGAGSVAIQFGLSSDKPVAADYDGDGRADQAVYRNGEWHLNRSSQGYTVVNFGLATDKPTVGDYDGDSRADQAVYRNGTWHILQSSQGSTAFQFGIASDIPAPADYDGDGRTDAAVYRDGTWYLRQSTSGISIQQFGLANDKPIPAAYLP